MTIKSRLEELDKLTEIQQKKLEKQLAIEYAKSLKDINKSLIEVYANYSVDGSLTYAEMAKYNRLTALEKQINDKLNILTKSNDKILRKSLNGTYTNGYFYTGFALETEGQVKLAYALLNTKQLEKAILNPLMELALGNNAIDIKKRIRSDITQGLTQGESYRKISKRVKSSLETNGNNAMKIAQTETHRVVNQAKQDSYEKAESKGIEMLKVWVSTLDSRTRDSHQDLDGVKVGIDKNFQSNIGGDGPGPGNLGNAADDINCRCTTITEFKGFETEQSFRRARGIDNKNEVIPYTTYNEWYNKRVIESN